MMRSIALAAATLGFVATLSGGAALAAVCQTDRLLCATTMPVDGYCECSAHGATEGGTVVPKGPPHQAINATAGGCGAHPKSPGCH
jgi:hypothetical protein